MKTTPKIDTSAVHSALTAIHRAEKEIIDYAEQCGLPLSFVSIYRTGMGEPVVRLGAYKRRLFKNDHGENRRDLTETSAEIGPRLWELIEEAAAAFKSKQKAA